MMLKMLLEGSHWQTPNQSPKTRVLRCTVSSSRPLLEKLPPLTLSLKEKSQQSTSTMLGVPRKAKLLPKPRLTTSSSGLTSSHPTTSSSRSTISSTEVTIRKLRRLRNNKRSARKRLPTVALDLETWHLSPRKKTTPSTSQVSPLSK
jgi:hypothetical protein